MELLKEAVTHLITAIHTMYTDTVTMGTVTATDLHTEAWMLTWGVSPCQILVYFSTVLWIDTIYIKYWSSGTIFFEKQSVAIKGLKYAVENAHICS